MADNTTLDSGSGGDAIVTREISHAGDTAKLQGMFVMGITGSEGSYTAAAVNGDASNGLDVDVTRVSGTVTVDGSGVTQPVSLPATVHSADYDTGGGTDTTLAFGIAVPASGGAAVVPGDATAGLKVDLGADNDVTVTGSVTANAGTNLNTSALALESGGNLADVKTAVQVMDDWDESDRAKVNPIAGQAGVAAGAGSVSALTQRVTLASDDPGVAHLATIAGDTTDIETAVELIDDAIVTDDAAFTPATTKVMMAGFEADEGSTDSVDEGDGGAARMTLDRKQIVNPQPHTQGGLSIFRSLDLDETEEDVKTSAGQVYGWYIFNASTSVRYVKFYNATAANVTVGSTTPVMTIPVPAATSGGVGFVSNSAMGIAFDTAISAAATTGLADNDTGAPSANDVVIQVFYK